jgi:hypothetical protein
MHSISLQDATSTALWRFHNRALDLAAIIYMFNRSTYEDHLGLHEIYLRQMTMLIDTVHEFCFSARRAVERAEEHKPGLISTLRRMTLSEELRDCSASICMSRERQSG